MVKKINNILTLCVLLIAPSLGAFDKALMDFVAPEEFLQEYQIDTKVFEEAAEKMLAFIKSLIEPKVASYCYDAKNNDTDTILLKRYVELVALQAVFYGKACVTLPIFSPDQLDYIVTGNIEVFPKNVTEEQAKVFVAKMEVQMSRFISAMERLGTKFGVDQLIEWEKWQESLDDQD